MVVRGVQVLGPLQLMAGSSPTSNWHENLDVCGTQILVPGPLKVVISPVCEGEWLSMEQGNKETYQAAEEGDNPEVLQYVIDQGCPQ